jgi:hypothetical protein
VSVRISDNKVILAQSMLTADYFYLCDNHCTERYIRYGALKAHTDFKLINFGKQVPHAIIIVVVEDEKVILKWVLKEEGELDSTASE